MKQGHRPVWAKVEMVTHKERAVWVPDHVRDPKQVQAYVEREIMGQSPDERLGPGSHAVEWRVKAINLPPGPVDDATMQGLSTAEILRMKGDA